MSFPMDAAPPSEGRRLLPEGTYELVITKVEEKKSSAGDPMVNVTCEVRNNPEFNGARVFHNVTFMSKEKPGAGMSSHFLKCINQPYEGAITVDPDAWIGEDFIAKIAVEDFEYKKGPKIGQKVQTNALKEIKSSDETPF